MADIPCLDDLQLLPYIDSQGCLPPDLEGKIGVYGIFDREQLLCYVGISRDVATSLKQHLVRVPDRCYWCKVWTTDQFDRDRLTEIQTRWRADLVVDRQLWEQPIDCQHLMTDKERADFNQAEDEIEKARILKNTARRVEQEIKAKLTDRGVSFEIRFHPKRKEEGLLDLKLW